MTDQEILWYYYKQMQVIEESLIGAKYLWDFNRIQIIENDKATIWNKIQELEEKIRKDWTLLNNC